MRFNKGFTPKKSKKLKKRRGSKRKRMTKPGRGGYRQ